VSDEPRRPENKIVHLTVYPKPPETRQRILAAILRNIIFKKLDEEQLEQCLDVMFERKLSAGEVVMRQGQSFKFLWFQRILKRNEGDPGDNFYVIDSGGFDVIRDGKLVTTLLPGRSFGELALMYNAPRNATVRVLSCSLLSSICNKNEGKCGINCMGNGQDRIQKYIDGLHNKKEIFA
jgi:cAMP-dependent protein kinase regulator